MADRFEVIDAFADGERVDPRALKQALAAPEGRDYLVDVWLLREGVQDDMRLEAVPSRPVRRAPSRSWLLAVAASIVCLIAGYVAGTRSLGATPGTAEAVSRGAEAPPPPSASFPIPPATRAIPVEFSADVARGGN